jgi:hypothetical protein
MRSPLVILLLVAIAAPVHAGILDGEREGFFVSGGVGAGYTTYSGHTRVILPDSLIDRSVDDNSMGAMFDIRIGGGISPRAQIYYQLQMVWFDEPHGTGAKEEIIATAHSGFGLTVYQKETAPSLYYFGSMGFRHWWAPFADDNTVWSGFGIMGGLGFEFLKRISLEASAAYGKPGNEVTTVKLWTFNAGVNLNLY